MKDVRFCGSERDATLLERAFPQPAEGWVDGVYHARAEHREPVAEGCDGGAGVRLHGARFVEESEALGGDPNTIARTAYHVGSVVCLGEVPSCPYRIELSLLGVDAAVDAWNVVINDVPVARCTVACGQRVRVRFTVELTCRKLELMLVPAGAFDDGDAADAAIELEGMDVERIERSASPAGPTIWIAADSTVQTYFDEERPQSGWGEWLYWYLYRDRQATVAHDEGGRTVQAMRYDGCGPTIRNRALGGRSARTYIDEGRFTALLSGVRENDIVLIQFGLNDTSTTRPMRYIPLEEFRGWLARYVESVLDRGARPVLITPPPQYHAPGVAVEPSVFDAYADVTRAYAADVDVPLIDLRTYAAAYLDELSPSNREAFFLRAPARQWASHPDGISDTVHLSTYGASACAGIVACCLAGFMGDVAFFDDDRMGAPEPPANVVARAKVGTIGLEGELRWDPARDADYWTVEKRSLETGRLYQRFVTVQPRLHDLPLPGQSRHVRYDVRAWRAGTGSEPATASMTLPASDNACLPADATLTA